MSNLPKGWELKYIEDIAEVKGGKRLPKGSSLSENVTPYPYIRVTNMYMGGIDFSDILYVPEDIQPQIKNYTISKNDLFISVAGTLGIVGEVPEELDNANLTENADKLTNIKINKKFLLYVLMSNLIQNEIKNQTTSNAQPKLALSRIKQFQIPVPPLEEQKKIADILSTVDKKIAFVEENINATEELKKGLMQKLLTEGIGHTEFKDSELGMIPESWEVVELLKVCEDNKRAIVDGPFGSNLKTIHFREEGIPVIQSNFVTSGKFNAKEYVYVDEDKFNSEIRSKVIGGDIVMAKIGANCGTSAIIPLEHPNALLSGNSIKISVDQNKASTVFIDFIFKSMYSRNKLVELKSVGAQPAISMPLLKKMKIVKPLLEEQKQIAEILSTVDKKIENLKEKKLFFQELKKGLMQKLLTGELRV
uniref:restriction endonuclease subunit S n=1 Tax=Aliarcobacter sp. TaxID=2321116 RepID=UPI00404763A5